MIRLAGGYDSGGSDASCRKSNVGFFGYVASALAVRFVHDFGSTIYAQI